jgi:chemotaxis regulatin CheY-phosphate phosphatase CheZ
MSEVRSHSPLNEADYGAIEAAVMETARGRWFLAEFAKRNRTADTEVLLGAMSRLENAVSGDRATQQIEHVRFDLMEMAKTITNLKTEVSATGEDGEQSRFMEATEALDAVVRTTESATSSILESAEQIQEVAWTLREAGADHAMCDTLDRRAADIYTACTFQDLTAQRTQKVVRTLRYIEGRINALIDAWSTSDRGARPSGEAEYRSTQAMAPFHDPNLMFDFPILPLSQSDIDVVIVENEYAPIDYELPHAYVVRAEAHPDSAATEIAFARIEQPDAASEPFALADDDDIRFADLETGHESPCPAYCLPDGQENSLSAIADMPTTDKLKLFS